MVYLSFLHQSLLGHQLLVAVAATTLKRLHLPVLQRAKVTRRQRKRVWNASQLRLRERINSKRQIKHLTEIQVFSDKDAAGAFDQHEAKYIRTGPRSGYESALGRNPSSHETIRGGPIVHQCSEHFVAGVWTGLTMILAI